MGRGNEGLPPMHGDLNSYEPHTDSEQQKFTASHNPMSYYSNDYTDSSMRRNALKKQSMYKRTTSAPTYGLKASTRGGIIPLSANKKIGKKKQNGNYMRQERNSGKNFLFANGALVLGVNKKLEIPRLRSIPSFVWQTQLKIVFLE